MKTLIAAIVVVTVAVYAAVILWGIRPDASFFRSSTQARTSVPWGPKGDEIRRGQDIFSHTTEYAAEYVGGALSCESCHAAGGIQPFAAPMVGIKSRFPQYSVRAARTITLADRVRECFVRSENGKPPADNSEVMRALLAYLDWLSPPGRAATKYIGAGLVKLPVLTPDPVTGAGIYAAQCAGCHGIHGQGQGMWPPVWGPDSFNQGAGMYKVQNLAGFVQHNMPQNRMGQLSPQEAYDVAAFIHQQSRPAMNPAFDRY
jgi:thiosulfate dehydrogenase